MICRLIKDSDFAALFGIELPDIGPVFASWRETDRKGVYGVDNVNFVAGDGKSFKLTATGSVASVINLNKADLGGVDLHLGLESADTDSVFKLTGTRFPDLGAVKGRMALTGDKNKL